MQFIAGIYIPVQSKNIDFSVFWTMSPKVKSCQMYYSI